MHPTDQPNYPQNYTTLGPDQEFFFSVDALKNKLYSDQVITSLMNGFLRRGMYSEFLQMTALRIELERQQKEEQRRRNAEERNKRVSRSFIYTIIVTLISSFLYQVYRPMVSASRLIAVCDLIFLIVFIIGVGSIVMMIFNALLRAGR